MKNWLDFKNPPAHEKQNDNRQEWLEFTEMAQPLVHNMANITKPTTKIIIKPKFTAPQIPLQQITIKNHHDFKLLQRLSQGYYPIQADCDLHGMTTEAAFRRFWQFMHECQHRKLRCIRIISGKGKGILQESLKQWLSMPEIAQKITAFTHPVAKFGGEGAQIILLKN